MLYKKFTYLSVNVSLANVDPIDVARNITGLNPETTLGNLYSFATLFMSCHSCFHFVASFDKLHLLMLAVVVVSKTFTTAETMLNARTLREWIIAALGLVKHAFHCQDVLRFRNLW